MSFPARIITHQKQICSLYKRTLRNLEAWYDRKEVYRYRSAQYRKRFDNLMKMKDMARATEILEEYERDLFTTQHYQPVKFPYSPGGCAYQREVVPSDWVLDYWDPLEKAQYPEYFALRERRKQQYITWWERKYGKPDPKDLAH